MEDVGPTAIKQNKIAFHHMLANSLADVVAEEAAKLLLPDMNLERKAKIAERTGGGLAKRLALVQPDIQAKRGEAGDIYELDSMLREEEGTPRSFARPSQKRLEMESLQRVPCRQTVQFLEQTTSWHINASTINSVTGPVRPPD